MKCVASVLFLEPMIVIFRSAGLQDDTIFLGVFTKLVPGLHFSSAGALLRMALCSFTKEGNRLTTLGHTKAVIAPGAAM